MTFFFVWHRWTGKIVGLCRDCRRIHRDTLHYCIVLPGLVSFTILS